MSMTTLILIATGIISYMAFNNKSLIEKLKHYPYTEKRDGEWYRLLTCGFVHGSMMHLLINMFVLWTFGEFVEHQMMYLFPGYGQFMYVVVYFLIIILANVPTSMKQKDNPYYAAVGASGGISGLVFIYILFNPWNMLYIYGIIPIPAIVGGVLYLGYSMWASKNKQDGTDHFAHFYGAVWGILLMIALKPAVLGQFIERLGQLPF